MKSPRAVVRAGWPLVARSVRSYAARHSGGARTLLLIAPGRVQTDLGGSDAPVAVEQVVPRIIDTIDFHRSAGGLHFVNAENEAVPW